MTTVEWTQYLLDLAEQIEVFCAAFGEAADMCQEEMDLCVLNEGRTIRAWEYCKSEFFDFIY